MSWHVPQHRERCRGPKPANLTWIEPDIVVDRASLRVQAAKADWEICPEAAEFIKNLA